MCEIKNPPVYKAGMKIKDKDYKDPACYGYIHLIGNCKVRCSWRKLCKSKSEINKRNNTSVN